MSRTKSVGCDLMAGSVTLLFIRMSTAVETPTKDASHQPRTSRHFLVA